MACRNGTGLLCGGADCSVKDGRGPLKGSSGIDVKSSVIYDVFV